ncbi:MAG: thioesterase family protein [Planctomycetota bacterium]
MITHTITIRVRYRDTDCGGVVYHSNYIDYFEWGRTELLRSKGATYRAMEDDGYQLVVVDAAARYHAPSYYDDELAIETTVEEHSAVRIQFSYRIERPSDQTLVCSGSTLLACLDAESGRPKRLPASIQERLDSS